MNMHQNDDDGAHMGLVSVAAATIAALAIGVGGSYWSGRVGALSPLTLSGITSSTIDDHTDDDDKLEKDSKTRSKERRKRHKDPLLDAIVKGGAKKKGGRKANAVAKALLSTSATSVITQTNDVERDNDDELIKTPTAESLDDPVASTSTSLPPRPTTQKSTKTIKPLTLTASNFEKHIAVFPGPWDEEEALKAQLSSSKKDEEMRSKSRRRDLSILRDSPLPSGVSQTPPITPASPMKRSDTPLSNSEVSTQTQIASLRGALEAARLREEKSKSDLDRLTKELEAMRWDHAGWRRREVEVCRNIFSLSP
jgi:hypothetical protein